MANVTGNATFSVESMDGTVDELRIPGSEFGHEDGDIGIDRDTGERSGTLIFKAFCDGFDLVLRISVYGTQATMDPLQVIEGDLESYEISKLTVINDNLDFKF
ncbi:hypothetical protein [Janthinobacterium lividum]|uniref:Uncharacterized protein n=1 Tax=Janthinobacterium lividum TaxID=29581 RepID=A0ABU0XW72_9BURK|nr:hypothetical protein [Janthinobacterium lividum]MDQ4627784.1 hypothetical protein [Janthinobacterium lividum]MDQ4676602.1 hypothetical protein [Janthinobacterium lividum]MDQ4686926.1 hypothetical protein [Janthinobacterium lividum]